MSSVVQFYNYQKAGDKERGFEKYKEILNLRKKNSEKAQTEARSESIGITPVYPIPKTYDEILADSSELETRLKNFIYSFFPDRTNLVRPQGMTANQFLLKTKPTSVIISQLLPDEKQFIVQHMNEIAEDLKKVAVLTPQYFMDYVRKFIGILRQEGAISSKFHQSTINNFHGNVPVASSASSAVSVMGTPIPSSSSSSSSSILPQASSAMKPISSYFGSSSVPPSTAHSSSAPIPITPAKPSSPSSSSLSTYQTAVSPLQSHIDRQTFINDFHKHHHFLAVPEFL
jgi:hypothetical protein